MLVLDTVHDNISVGFIVLEDFGESDGSRIRRYILKRRTEMVDFELEEKGTKVTISTVIEKREGLELYDSSLPLHTSISPRSLSKNSIKADGALPPALISWAKRM